MFMFISVGPAVTNVWKAHTQTVSDVAKWIHSYKIKLYTSQNRLVDTSIGGIVWVGHWKFSVW